MARLATAWPMRPMPTMPSRFPKIRWPSIQVGDQPCHSPSAFLSIVAPSVSRRGTARISAMVMSAVSSVSTPGVLVTMMLRLRAVSRSILSTPVPNWAISFKSGPAWLSTPRSMRSVTVGTSTLAVLTASISSSWRERPVVEIEACVEQLTQPRLNDVGKLAGDDNDWSLSHKWSSQEGGGEGSPQGIAPIAGRAAFLTEPASRDKASSWLGATIRSLFWFIQESGDSGLSGLTTETPGRDLGAVRHLVSIAIGGVVALLLACAGAPAGDDVAGHAALGAGKSSLPVPRFVSLKSDKVNVRRAQPPISRSSGCSRAPAYPSR